MSVEGNVTSAHLKIMAAAIFKDFDLTSFWDDSEYALEVYV
jgi:hypothetical protein